MLKTAAKCLSLLYTCSVLSGCTQQEFNSQIQAAAVISCMLADGSQVEYALASAIVSQQKDPSGPRSQNILETSGLIVIGSRTMCSSLSNINSTIPPLPPVK